jgi:hypothetical protein
MIIMKKRMLLLTLGTILVTAVVLNVSINLSANKTYRAVVAANIEALAQAESIPACPVASGGYQSTGTRDEDIKTMWVKIEIASGSIMGIFGIKGEEVTGFSWQRLPTVAYDCSGNSSAVCWVCNRYVLK